MQKGLILGKFMPLHNGHIKLIEFAQTHCESLIILLCSTLNEPIRASTRFLWLKEHFKDSNVIEVLPFYYDEGFMPGLSKSSTDVWYLWAQMLKSQFPNVSVFISSESYGKYISNTMGVKLVTFDPKREEIPVSSGLIRQDPLKYWDFLPDVVKKHNYMKVCIVGSASARKTAFVRKLAEHFNSDFILDVGKGIADIKEDCTYENLKSIAKIDAQRIVEKDKLINKVLFVDIDIYISNLYANCLFKNNSGVEDWISKAYCFDLYLYLENDTTKSKNETKVLKEERAKQECILKEEFNFRQIFYIPISGSWEERLNKAIQIINKEFCIAD